MTRRLSWSAGFARTTLAPLLFMWASGCASTGTAGGGGGGGGTTNLSYGYMVPGPQVAAALGLTATDTLPELPARTTLPAVLVNAISQEVTQGAWNNRCTRRFGGPQRYAVIFHRACDSSLGPDAEPVVVVGFTADGRTAGRVRWSGPETVTVLQPVRRF